MKVGPFQSSGQSVAVAAPPGPLPVREAEKEVRLFPGEGSRVWVDTKGGLV